MSLLFNFLKRFFNVLLFWNSKLASTVHGDRAIKHTRDVNIIRVIPAGPVKTLCTHSIEELEFYKAIGLTESIVVIFHIFNSIILLWWDWVQLSFIQFQQHEFPEI